MAEAPIANYEKSKVTFNLYSRGLQSGLNMLNKQKAMDVVAGKKTQ